MANDDYDERDDDAEDGDDEATEAAAPAERDLAAKVRDTVYALADGDVISGAALRAQINEAGHVPDKALREAIDDAATNGVIDVVSAGDPPRPHYRKPPVAMTRAVLTAACLALARLPGAEDDGDSAMTAEEVAMALNVRCGSAHTADSAETILFALLKANIVEAHTVTRVSADVSPVSHRDDDDFVPTNVTGYAFVAGTLDALLGPAFDALLGGATPQQAATDARVAEAERKLAAAIAERDAAIETARLAADALVSRVVAQQSCATAPVAEAPTVDDARGKATRYEQRLPLTMEREALAGREDRKIRHEIDKLNAQIDDADKAARLAKADVTKKIAALAQQLKDMDAAVEEGVYLRIVQAAYKVFDPETKRVAIHDYDTRAFVCWDDPHDLPQGAQPALPGFDATGPDGQAPAVDPPAKTTAKRVRKPRTVKPKPDATDAPAVAADVASVPEEAPAAVVVTDAASDVEDAPTPPVEPAAVAQVEAPAEEAPLVVEAVAPTDDAAGADEDRGPETVPGPFQRPAAPPQLDATWFSKKAEEPAAEEPAPAPIVEAPAPVEAAPEKPSEADASQKAFGPIKVTVLKLLVAELIDKHGPMAWGTSDGALLDNYAEIMVEHMGRPASLAHDAAFRTMLRASIESKVRNRVVAQSEVDGKLVIDKFVEEPAEAKSTKGRKPKA